MEQLRAPSDGHDAVSRLLTAVRVRTTIYCRSSMRAPWGFGVEAHGNPAFHLVTGGSCWLQVDGEAEQLEVETGDLVVLPAGPRHWLRDDPATPARELEEILATTPRERHKRLRYGGSGPKTGLLCGGFALEGAAAPPMLRALPPVVRIRGVAGRPAPWVGATLALLSSHAESDAPGADAVVARLSDVLLTQALRIALVDATGRGGAPTLALMDPQVAAAIELIHREPGRPWAVGELASSVGLSRSAFSSRFRELVGESPKRYLTHCRLSHAARLLHTTDLGLAEIARRTGYESEFSFSKAFKRIFGVAPGSYRARPEEWESKIELLAAGDNG